MVVPVYRSAETLAELATRVAAAMDGLGRRFELVLVNDGSPDGSWAAIQGLAAKDPRIQGLDLMRNYGQHNALLAGIRAARHEVVVTMDDDLQNPPEEIGRMLAVLEQGHDVVYGTPRAMHHGLWRNAASRITKLALQSFMGAETASRVSAFRAFRTRLRAGFADYRSSYVSIDVLLTWSTRRFAHVEVDHHPRKSGVSNYRLGMLMTHALNMVTGFSTWPLQVASLLGFLLALFGFAILAFVLARWFVFGGIVPGFTFLASVISLFAGAQLFALGLIGEYLARMHFRMMERPPYVVSRTADDPAAEKSGDRRAEAALSRR